MTNKRIPIKIVAETSSEVVREGTGDWDFDDLNWSITIRGFDVGRNENDYDFIVSPPIKSEYYLVYVSYDTGESFHREYGKVCFAELFDNFEDAETVAIAILNDARQDPNRSNFGPIKVKLTGGRTVEVSVSDWKGYFEKFNSVEVETVRRTRKFEL